MSDSPAPGVDEGKALIQKMTEATICTINRGGLMSEARLSSLLFSSFGTTASYTPSLSVREASI